MNYGNTSEQVRTLGPIRKHFWRVQRMARAVDVNLVSAAKGDLIDDEAWANMITRCRGCQWADGCGRWLKQAALTGHERTAPNQCRNRNVFDALRTKSGSGS
ncbi:DUF6455 family protein [Thalassococcus lentus]|uniref:DUF6455 family protein n=1 Tax=Thalassococcus lentus TaxID=1210524 RepID=A0ABT4XPD4_9RHOB|nr:DUF6455 family protein [Thalassococcus lentus]MDA7423813.1 DUF6455 family protein [Thalassococcus lentus]